MLWPVGARDGEFAEDSPRAYYEEHKDDFKLERPMVKGVYLKLLDDAPKLKQIRRLYRSDSPGDIDKLEKAAIGTAIHYDYFRDSWIDWEQIENRIPVEFSRGRCRRDSPAPLSRSRGPGICISAVCERVLASRGGDALRGSA